MISADLGPRSGHRRPPRLAIIAGACLLALFIAVEIILGPWAANWLLATLWFVVAALVTSVWLRVRRIEPATPELEQPLRLTRWAIFALAVGFTGLGASTAFRASGGTNAVLLGLLYAIAAIGGVASWVFGRATSSGPPADRDPPSVGTA